MENRVLFRGIRENGNHRTKPCTFWQKWKPRDKRGYYAENLSLYAKYYGVCIGFHDILKKSFRTVDIRPFFLMQSRQQKQYGNF